jgi:ATP-dependent Clp protease adaptor protein ClpS
MKEEKNTPYRFDKMFLQTLPEIQIIQETETELEALYTVTIHNDDVTPMNFVVEVLKQIFFLGNDRAAEIMLTAHIKGSAYVQTLPKSEAGNRIEKARYAAQMEGYPLHFSMERE